MRTSVCVYACVLVLAGIVTCFASDDASCPVAISVEERTISPSPEWRVSYNSRPHLLEMVTFFSGPPEENASLVYDEKSKIKGGWVGIWRLSKDERGYWIRCAYEGTHAELSRRIPDSVTVCTVTYDEGAHFASGLPVIQKIECR